MPARMYHVAPIFLALLAVSAHAQFYKIPVYDDPPGLKADLNHDGKPDLVTLISTLNGVSVSAALGDGKGGFGAAILTAITNIDFGGSAFAVGDLNNDGFPDVVVGGTDHVTGASAVGIMLGNGDGTFRTTKEIVIGSNYFDVAVTGDFNGDGNTDIALAGGTDIVSLLGKGNGSFGSPITSAGAGGLCAAVGDFNNDGKLDLTVGASVSLGNGDGTFQGPISVPDGGCDVAVADLNHDGNLDLITGSFYNQSSPVHVYLGDGTGQFKNSASYLSGGYSLAVADFNGDGFPDFASANTDYNGGSITIFLNRGDGTFFSGGTFLSEGSTVVAGDFNSDNKQDLVTPFFLDQEGHEHDGVGGWPTLPI